MLVVGLDLGTQSLKAVVCDERLEVLGSHAAAYATTYLRAARRSRTRACGRRRGHPSDPWRALPEPMVETHAYPSQAWFPGWIRGSGAARLLGCPTDAELDALASLGPAGVDGVTFVPALAGAMTPDGRGADVLGLRHAVASRTDTNAIRAAMLALVALGLVPDLRGGRCCDARSGDDRYTGDSRGPMPRRPDQPPVALGRSPRSANRRGLSRSGFAVDQLQ